MALGPGGGRGVVQRDLIRIEGLRELRRAFRQVENLEGATELRDGMKAAADVVAQEAKSRARPFSNRAADTIRARSGGNRAFVVGGKASLRWYGWADFGSRNPRSGQPRRVGPWANSGAGPERGRFIYAAFDAKEREVAELVEEAINRALRRLGL